MSVLLALQALAFALHQAFAQPATGAQAAVHGITGPTFNLSASAGAISEPDGAAIYAWGYGCASAPAGFAPVFATGTGPAPSCGLMQLPGPLT